MKENQKKGIYESFRNLSEALSSAGIYTEETVGTQGKIEAINDKVKSVSMWMVGFVLVMALALLGVIFDTIYFHVETGSSREERFRSAEQSISLLKREDSEILKRIESLEEENKLFQKAFSCLKGRKPENMNICFE